MAFALDPFCSSVAAVALSYVTVSRVLTPRGLGGASEGHLPLFDVLYPLEQIGCDGMHNFVALPRVASHATSDSAFRPQGAHRASRVSINGRVDVGGGAV